MPTNAWQDYALLDSGDGRKLERFGPVTLIRPEAQADWRPALPGGVWAAADAEFIAASRGQAAHWRYRRPLHQPWTLHYGTLRFSVQARESRQVGVFPENAAQWDWLAVQIAAAQHAAAPPLQVLNLFGYTGLASLAAAAVGAHVTHVDASKKAVAWARANQRLSGLADHPIRWIIEDALTYLRREQRRGMRYHGIVLDPPAFGRGPDGQIWQFERLFPYLIEACRAVLSPSPRFVLATVYTKTMTEAALQQTMAVLGPVQTGRLTTTEQSAGRVLSNAWYARWQAQPL
ncbi:MAG: class I SAM-dependent methyltransferase [Caldilineales bacterium]